MQTWEGAYAELGPEFEAVFGPQPPHHARYIELPNQVDQGDAFWTRPGTVAVIDASILRYFSEASGRSMEDVTLNRAFPPVTDFKVGFRNAEIRDELDSGLARLCANGGYSGLLDR